jgi:hypothetical protein
LFGHEAHSKRTTDAARGKCHARLRNKDGLIDAIYLTAAQSGSVQEPKAGDNLADMVAKV